MFCLESAPEDLIYNFCAALDARKVRIPWLGEGPLPLDVLCKDNKDGALYLPTQDCTNDYGEAVQLLRIDILTPDVFSAEPVQRIAPQRIHPGYTDGLHTLAAPVTSPMGDSGYSDVTLFDVKHLDHSGARRWINLQRRVRRLAGMA